MQDGSEQAHPTRALLPSVVFCGKSDRWRAGSCSSGRRLSARRRVFAIRSREPPCVPQLACHFWPAKIAGQRRQATPTEDVESSVGDSDPLKAIEDALRTFPADEIIVVTRPEDQAGWLEEGAGETAQARFRLPVTRVTIAEDGSFAQSG
jgi:hypothetical protein